MAKDNKNSPSRNPWIWFPLTRYFWTNLLLFIIILSVLGLVGNMVLDQFTRHGEGNAMPDLKGMPLEKAIAVLEKNKLRPQITGRIFSEEFPRNSVTDQNPTPNEKVKSGRLVYLTVNSLDVPEIEVTFQGNSSFREYQSYLNNLGLKVGQITKTIDEFPGRVLKASIAGKTLNEIPVSVPKGTVVDLEITISEDEAKEDEKVSMISNKVLLKMTLEEARQYLQDRGLDIGKVQTKTAKTDTSAATIYKVKSSFKAGTLVPRGTTLDVFVK